MCPVPSPRPTPTPTPATSRAEGPGPGASGERDHAGQGGICATFIVPGSPLGPRVSIAPQQAIPVEGFTEQRDRGRGRASSTVNLSRKAHSALSAPAPPPHVLPRQLPRPGNGSSCPSRWQRRSGIYPSICKEIGFSSSLTSSVLCSGHSSGPETR